ncbi:hypothetical protein ACFYV7_36660 [Nocardia suismassiliense]|uniref:Uncharacterized protein n=1 Tax=Nocardia suismassiliense TaxID=2077092 RepID=A0ABW6R4D2_9NOCA
MIVSVLFLLLAVGHLALASIGVSQIRAGASRMFLLPTVLCAALCYDNAVLALGSTLGEGRPLELLSVPRFALHAILTPLLVLWARAAMDRADIPVARRRGVQAAAVALAIALIAIGSLHVLQLDLRPRWWAGALRYTDIDGSAAMALPAIIAGLVVLAAGIALWRRHGYRVLFATAAVMTLVAGAAPVIPVLGNAGELILSAGLLGTADWLRRRDEDRSMVSQ